MKTLAIRIEMTPHQSQDSEGMIQRLTRLEVARSDEDTIDWITGSQDATEDIAVPIRNRKMRSEIYDSQDARCTDRIRPEGIDIGYRRKRMADPTGTRGS